MSYYSGGHNTLTWAVLTILLTLLGRFLYKGFVWRRHVSKLPGPPHHPIWGHLRIMGEAARASPQGAAGQTLALVVKQQYNLPDIFYMDLWPISPSLLVTTHPALSNQFTTQTSMPKHPAVESFTKIFSGGGDMVASEGMQWKTWRSAFNPGFSSSHLMTLMPFIVDDVNTFVGILQSHAAKKEPFRLEHHATRLTIDIIGKVVLDDHFNSQTSENPLVTAFESQVKLIGLLFVQKPTQIFDVMRYYYRWQNTKTMNAYVNKRLEDRFSTRKSRGKTKYVIDLALETYLKENAVSEDSNKLDPTFKDAALRNIKIFIFAGHDTSSSAICYFHYELSRNGEALAKVRKELDDIFGTDLSKTGDMIKADPYLLNKMEYGHAVIRETLRLHPPASSVRRGSKDFFLTDPKTGERYPTDGWMLFSQNVGQHYNPDIWGEDAMTFRPERWLDNSPQSSAGRDAFIAFSKGPRNCIGQELALLELRMVLAMTIREFDFQEAFAEVERLKGDGSGYPSNLSGIQKQFGQEAYQVQMGTAKPREGMPCRLSIAKR